MKRQDFLILILGMVIGAMVCAVAMLGNQALDAIATVGGFA